MAGHNKWSKIKHRKAHVEKKKTRIWTKIIKTIMVAAKNGGTDPDCNLPLRYAIDEARYANVPRDTIERAIKKGAGELGGQNYENLRYEGYGPGGAAVVIEALTDNRTRTAADVRMIFSKYGGNLGATGCVAFMFESRGQILVAPKGVNGDRLMETAIEAGAQDIAEPQADDAPWVVFTDPPDFQRVKAAIDKAGFPIESAELTLIPTNTTRVEGDNAVNLLKLIDALEDHDDVQKVYSNYDVPEDALAQVE
ncbi:MAG: YebC/PmpR family DNA-binding transcriptional regulator [Phycisphaerales bacterium]